MIRVNEKLDRIVDLIDNQQHPFTSTELSAHPKDPQLSSILEPNVRLPLKTVEEINNFEIKLSNHPFQMQMVKNCIENHNILSTMSLLCR